MGVPYLLGYFLCPDITGLKQTTTTTATRTSLNKWFNELWLCMCVISLYTFLCRPLQNNDVK